jgi:Leucine-rich repeat (LRR) protein
MSNNKISEIPKDKFTKMFGLEVLNLASNNIEDLDSITGLRDFKGLRNLNLLSNNFKYRNLFTSNGPASQDEEKDNIKTHICEMVPTLRMLNCEEIITKVVPKVAEQSECEELILTEPNEKKHESNPKEPSIKSPPKTEKVKETRPEVSIKEKQKKQSESVICIIEDEWNAELQRLKDSGTVNILIIFRYVFNKL